MAFDACRSPGTDTHTHTHTHTHCDYWLWHPPPTHPLSHMHLPPPTHAHTHTIYILHACAQAMAQVSQNERNIYSVTDMDHGHTTCQPPQFFSLPQTRLVPQLLTALWPSSVQFKMVSMRSEKLICAPPRHSEISPMLPLKHFQCSSNWRWPFLVLSRKIV